MGSFVGRIENEFFELGRPRSLLFGVIAGSTLLVPFFAGFGEWPLVLCFVAYLPFHAWLTISLFLVLFSGHERQRILRYETGPFLGFVGRVFSEYGMFCLGWFYTLMVVMFFTGRT